MRLSTSISCMKDGQARSAMAVFWRWQSGGAAESSLCSAFARERMQGLAKKGCGQLEFELDDHQAQLSLSSESSSKLEADSYFSKTWETHKNAPASTNTDLGNQFHNNVFKQEHAHALHQPAAPRLPAVSPHHDHTLPIRRLWQCTPHTTETPSQESFVITSFNILASAHANVHRHLYLSVPIDLLAWSTRKKKVLQELDLRSPDIICLQEVDKFRDLEEDLALRGYTGLYKVRTGEMPDGCAIFWRRARFQLLQERSFEFSMLGMRNNVAQLCVLQLIVPGVKNSRNRIEERAQSHRLIVGNIHVLFNPKRGDIKLGQCRAFLEQVHNMSSIWHGAPVVIGGDFNSTPSSAVYKFLAASELDLSGLDRRYLSGLSPEVVDFNKKRLGKEMTSPGMLKEMSAGRCTSELASQEKADEPASSTSDESVSSTLPFCVSPVETLEHFKMDKHSAPSPESIFKEQSAALPRTNPCESLGSSLEGGNGKDLPMEQILANGWDLEELRVATGKTDCMLMQHELNLYSAYSDIQGHALTRDAKGEPLLTTCHRDFSGTVDYIWRNDGLKTVKVLETVPVKAFARNKGLPIMMWGSDHLALVCELAFT